MLPALDTISTILLIIGFPWCIISTTMLQRYYISRYTTTVLSRIPAFFRLSRLFLWNNIKGDDRLNMLLWHVRISSLVYIIGCFIKFIPYLPGS